MDRLSRRRVLAGVAIAGALVVGVLMVTREGEESPARDGDSVQAEIALIRELVAQVRQTELAEILDSSMVSIPEGWALMGSDSAFSNESPARTVYLDAFRIDRYEVTNVQYARFLAATGTPAPVYWAGGDPADRFLDYPVLGVSWEQARDYCAWADKRLPTEAEWERACRGTSGRAYPWGSVWEPTLANITVLAMPDRDDAWPMLAGTEPPTAAFPSPVGSYPDGASPYGVLDLSGNATEWVADWYDPAAYERLPPENPLGDGPPWNHSIRGSAWLYPHDAPEDLPEVSTCSYRAGAHVYDDPRIGFRCARAP